MFYQIIKVGNDEIGVAWSKTDGSFLIERIYLPGKEAMIFKILRDYPEIDLRPRHIVNGVDRVIADLFQGKNRDFSLSLLDFSRLMDFASKVLKETCRIPHGQVISYCGLAEKIGHPRAVRAVGTALANNPFPIVIPCHRVILADGRLGRFGGGSEMKKQLLKNEGVILNEQGNRRNRCGMHSGDRKRKI